MLWEDMGKSEGAIMRKGQTKTQSVIEATVNISSGMIIAYCIMQYILAPWLDIGISSSQNVVVTIVLTVVSMARSYIWRRYFDKIMLKSQRRIYNEE